MMPVLVTGGAGFVGSHTCKALSRQGFLPVTFDNLSRGHVAAVRFGPIYEGDMLRPEDLENAFQLHRPQAVLHFAAFAYVGESVERPLEYYRNNLGGLINVLDAMERHGVNKIVFSSSCATYGVPESVAIAESSGQKPINPYGWSKLMCERVLIDVANSRPLRYAVLRYFNAAGADPDGELFEAHDPETHLIPLTIDAATGAGRPLEIFGSDYDTADGTCERDYIHVVDLAETHVTALNALNTSASLTVNLGAGKAVSVKQIVAEVQRVTGREVPHVYASRRPGDPPRLVADITHAEALLGFRPHRSALANIVDTAWRSRQQPR
jgi:UDP-arabinose 4-epimerase